jgi:hypothetical protein
VRGDGWPAGCVVGGGHGRLRATTYTSTKPDRNDRRPTMRKMATVSPAPVCGSTATVDELARSTGPEAWTTGAGVVGTVAGGETDTGGEVLTTVVATGGTVVTGGTPQSVRGGTAAAHVVVGGVVGWVGTVIGSQPPGGAWTVSGPELYVTPSAHTMFTATVACEVC